MRGLKFVSLRNSDPESIEITIGKLDEMQRYSRQLKQEADQILCRLKVHCNIGGVRILN